MGLYLFGIFYFYETIQQLLSIKPLMLFFFSERRAALTQLGF
jgi:hypothetical protein